MRKFSKMPLRKLGDGKIGIRDNGDEFWQITCGGQVLSVSEHNLVKIFGIIALMLGIPLTKAVGEAIEL